MKYQFKRQDAIDFAMHVHQSTRIRGDEEELKLCPYCRGGSNKDKYTFSINLKTGLFKCLRSGCGQQGSMWRLAQDFDFKLSDEFSRYSAKAQATRKLIHARFAEGRTLEDFKTVIDLKVAEWKNDPVMCKYLRPETLFCTKFERYLMDAERNKKVAEPVVGETVEEPEMTDEEWLKL